MTKILEFIRRTSRDPHVREFALWCLPALILGMILRGLLTVHLPYAFFHDDSPDYLTTPDSLLFKHRWELHGKKTFLVPLLYCIPFLLHLKASFFVPVAQHALGLCSAVLAGILVRLWFVYWRWFIIPITAIVAADPFLIWYEHSFMAEPAYVFCTLLLALAGTFYTFSQTRNRFTFLCTALVLEAGARPEGKLLFGFGILLVIVLHAREWRSTWGRLAVVVVLAIGMHFITKTSQAGLLIYTSVARFTPENMKCAPGLEPYIAPIRAHLQERWSERQAFPKVVDRGQVSDAVEAYLRHNPGHMVVSRHRSVNQFCMKLAMETCRRNLDKLPEIVYYKFRQTSTEMPSGIFDNEWLFHTQREAYFGSLERNFRLSKLMFGFKIANSVELTQFIDTHYGEVPWFNQLASGWLKTVSSWRLPDQKKPIGKLIIVRDGIPIYFLLGAAGCLLIMLRTGPLQRFHMIWGLALAGLFFVVILTANVKPRFRLVFEPFWFIYIGVIFDLLLTALRRVFVKKPPLPKTATDEPEPAEVIAS